MSVKDETLIEVQNLSGYSVSYISYEGRRQNFEPHQKKKIKAEELRQLAYSRGGLVLLKDYLSVKNQELAKEFNVSDDSFEHEYQWTKADVDRVLLHGSDDSLRDALDFAPQGIIDLIIERAVYLKINDINKRKIIEEMTGKNVNNMIEVIETSAEDGKSGTLEVEKKTRRTETKKEETGRRVQE